MGEPFVFLYYTIKPVSMKYQKRAAISLGVYNFLPDLNTIKLIAHVFSEHRIVISRQVDDLGTIL